MKKYNILIYPQKSADGVCRLRLKIRYGGRQLAISLGWNVDANKWNAATNRCARNTFHGKHKTSAAVINGELQRWEDAANKVLSKADETVEPSSIKREILAIIRPERDKREQASVLQDIDEYITLMSIERAWSAKQCGTLRTIYTRLEEWRSNVSYDDLGSNGLTELVQHWSDNGLTARTMQLYLSVIKTFLKWAIKQNKTKIAYNVPKIKCMTKPVIYLTWDELMKFYGMEVQKKDREVRDMFCLSCFTGLRFSDVSALTDANIVDDAIVVAAIKTGKQTKIELNKYSREIIGRYVGHGNLFSASYKHRNETLHRLFADAGFDDDVMISEYRGGRRVDKVAKKYEVLTFHSGRRTFISNALTLGIPVQVVMQWSGHSDYHSMRPYIAIADEAKKKAMSLFDR